MLFNSQVEKIPERGVYLGILRVVSTPSGFKAMVERLHPRHDSQLTS